MKRFSRVVRTTSALALALTLSACSSFDPADLLDNSFFNTKKSLPGERRAVFPEGTPGVTQGMPPELVRGYQQNSAEPDPVTTQQTATPAAKARPKTEPKPKSQAKVAARPAPSASPPGPGPSPGARPGEFAWPDPGSPSSQPAASQPPVESQPPAAARRSPSVQSQQAVPVQRQPPAGPMIGLPQTPGQVAWPEPPAPGTFSR